jgi:hypothetical protein
MLAKSLATLAWKNSDCAALQAAKEKMAQFSSCPRAAANAPSAPFAALS